MTTGGQISARIEAVLGETARRVFRHPGTTLAVVAIDDVQGTYGQRHEREPLPALVAGGEVLRPVAGVVTREPSRLQRKFAAN
jgi:hypothetical protein